MNTVEDILANLYARLPELEWKIANLAASFSNALPHGLFQSTAGLTAKSCIEDIKSHMHILSKQKNPRAAAYVAQRIQQKISVLVALCNMPAPQKPVEKTAFSLDKLSTKKQWVLEMEEQISTLTAQQTAMASSLALMEQKNNVAGLLAVQKELGEIEKQVTLAKETLMKSLG